MLVETTHLVERSLRVPAVFFGLGGFAVLVFLLLATTAIGKGRPDRR